MTLQDGDFSESRFRDIVNAFLANSLGNLLNRTQGLLKKNCNGTLPVGSSSIPADNPLRVVAAEQVCRVHHFRVCGKGGRTWSSPPCCHSAHMCCPVSKDRSHLLMFCNSMRPGVLCHVC